MSDIETQTPEITEVSATPAIEVASSQTVSLESQAETLTTDAAQPLDVAQPAIAQVVQESVTPAAQANPEKKQRSARNKKRKPSAPVKEKDQAWVSYKPSDIVKRIQNRRAIWDAYMDEARSLSLQIRQWGLGASLALLLSQTQSKRKRRIYWDLSKWMIKERRLKGKNARSLIESVIYGDSFYLLRATEASLGFLEEILFLGEQKAYQPENAPKKTVVRPKQSPDKPIEEAPTQAEVIEPEIAEPTVIEPEIAEPAVIEEIAEPAAPEETDHNDETRSATVHA
jgi:hypothetical protein